MRLDTQFSVFLVNKPGILAQVTESVAKAKVNIVAMTMMDSSEHGVLRLVVDDPAKARAALRKDHDNWAETEVIAMQLPNEPGALAGVARRLSDAHINISYAYTSGGAPGGKTTCIFKVADPKKAMKLLASLNGGETLGQKRRATVRRSIGSRRQG